MGGSPFRYERGDGRPLPAMYWRRRFLALVVGLAILGTVSWAFSGVLGGGSGGSTVADVGNARGAHSSSSGTPGPVSPTPVSPTPVSPPASSPAAAPPAVPACAPADIVLSVFASQASYGPGTPPEFDVAVVSTAGQTCTFNVGPRFLDLVISAGGKRVWGSADCAAAPGSVVTSLARGVPLILPVSWDLQTSTPGCPAKAGQAGPGTYAATASDNGDASSPVSFTLTPGAVR